MKRSQPLTVIDKTICKICNKTVKSIALHIKIHNISRQEYYDKYLKLDDSENTCVNCGIEVDFQKPGYDYGYKNACSRKCGTKHAATINKESISKKREATNLKKYGVKYVSQNDEIKKKFTEKLQNKTIEERHEITKKTKKTKLEKYGDENYTNVTKGKETKLEKYGDENYNNREKSKQTCKLNYNVDNPSQSEIIKQRKTDTLLRNYNVTNPSHIPTHIEKSKITNRKNYGVDWAPQNIELQNQIKKSHYKRTFNKLFNISDGILKDKFEPLFTVDTFLGVQDINYDFKCKTCNTEFSDDLDNGEYPICPTCYPKGSRAEIEIVDFLRTLDPNMKIVRNDRSIISNELDIYLPDYQIAIEHNGLYWHSEKAANKSPMYHVNKTNECLDKGIHLIHIFSNYWTRDTDIVKHRLKHILHFSDKTVYARKTIIKEIEPKIKNDFLNKYHLQHEDRSSIKLGAFYNDELISVMTFALPRIVTGDRKNKNETRYELSRFASKYNTPGMFSKFMKFFKTNYQYNSIYTFANRSWGEGNVYLKNGFTLVNTSKPSYSYTKNYTTLIHRFKYRKSELPKYFKTILATEKETMFANGFDRIWDCGTNRYDLTS